MRALLAIGLLATAACGYKGPVSRIDPDDRSIGRTERQALRAAEKAEVEAGLAIPAEARPVRVDDLQLRLEERPADPFSLPPAGTDAVTAPFPGTDRPSAAPAPSPAPPPAAGTPR